MNVRVVTAGEADEWDAVLERCDGTDVHFGASYHRACEADGRGEALLLVAEEGAAVLAHPVLVRRVERVGAEAMTADWFDAESAYGYTGPVATVVPDSAFLARAWTEISTVLRERGVVAEFVRLHPYLANERLLPEAYHVHRVRRSVVLPLEGRSEHELWSAYPPAQRNMVRRAAREGLVWREHDVAGSALDRFVDLYDRSMRRLGAGAEYFFSSAYLEALAGDARLFVVEQEDEFAAAGIFLVGRRILHYHLGAAQEDGVPGRTNLLLHGAAAWGLAHGLSSLHLGGGVTGAQGDSLYRFKLSISTETRPVHVAGVVHDAAAYDRLCASWLAQAHRDAPRFHLLYRLPIGV